LVATAPSARLEGASVRAEAVQEAATPPSPVSESELPTEAENTTRIAAILAVSRCVIPPALYLWRRLEGESAYSSVIPVLYASAI
jgi:hypothetical protein